MTVDQWINIMSIQLTIEDTLTLSPFPALEQVLGARLVPHPDFISAMPYGGPTWWQLQDAFWYYFWFFFTSLVKMKSKFKMQIDVALAVMRTLKQTVVVRREISRKAKLLICSRFAIQTSLMVMSFLQRQKETEITFIFLQLRRRMSRLPCLSWHQCDMDPNRWQKMDRWMKKFSLIKYLSL